MGRVGTACGLLLPRPSQRSPAPSLSLLLSRLQPSVPFPHRRVSPRLLQRIQSRVAEKEEEAPVPARHPPPYWTRTRERERRRGSLRRRQGHRRLSRRRGFRLSQLAGEETPAPLARSCGGAGENEGGGRGAPTPALGEGTEVAMERRAGGETCPSAGWGLGEGGTPAGQGRGGEEGGDFTWRRGSQTWDGSMVCVGYRGGIWDCLWGEVEGETGGEGCLLMGEGTE